MIEQFLFGVAIWFAIGVGAHLLMVVYDLIVFKKWSLKFKDAGIVFKAGLFGPIALWEVLRFMWDYTFHSEDYLEEDETEEILMVRGLNDEEKKEVTDLLDKILARRKGGNEDVE